MEDEAVRLISSRIQTQPEISDNYFLMGRLLMLLVQPRNARYYFEKAVLYNPGDIFGHINLAIALASYGDLDGAEQTLTVCLDKFPTHNLPARVMGDILVRKQLYRESIDFYYKSLMIAPNDPDALKGMANAAYEIGEYAIALDHLQRLRVIQPGVEEARWNELVSLLKSALAVKKKH